MISPPFACPENIILPRMLYGRFVVPWLPRRQDRLIAVSRYTAGDITTFFQPAPGRFAGDP